MKKENINKGDYGYILATKKSRLIIAIISLAMVFIICITGIIIYNTPKTIFAVMAALASLPAAKLLISYIVIMRYPPVTEEIKNSIEDIVANTDKKYEILYDVALSSTEKGYYAGAVFIYDGHIYGYTDFYKNKNINDKNNSKNTLQTIEKHIKSIIDANCNYSVIKMYDDKDKFLNSIRTSLRDDSSISSDDMIKIENMNKKIAEQIKIYMF